MSNGKPRPKPDYVQAVEMMLPQNVEAEAGVLGSIEIDPEAISQVADFLAAADFYIEQNRAIYQAALDLHRKKKPTDLLTLCDELTVRGQLEDVGGASYVSSLANQVPTSRNVKHYAEIVQRCAIERRLVGAASDIAGAAYSETDDPEGLVEYCVELVRNAAGEGRRRKSAYRLQTVQDILNQPQPEPLIQSLYSLNSTGVVCAPSGVGKTALLLDQMAHVALDRAWNGHVVTGGHVVYVCAEGQAFLPERLAALMLKLGVDDIPRLHILPEPVQLLEPRTVARLIRTCTDELPEPPVWIAFDTLSQTASGIRENDADQMSAYISAMGRIREATGAFVAAIHHTGKDEERGARGSSAIKANVDTMVLVTKTDDVAVVKCDKQRGGSKPFKPFGFKVVSQALDEHADRTGPVIELCEVQDPAVAPAKTMPEQVRAVYDVFMEIHSEFLSHPESPGGVFFGTWEKKCSELGISSSTFKNARKRLLDKSDFNLIYQPVEKGACYPVGWDPKQGTKGQRGDNGPIDPVDIGESPQEGQRDKRSRGIVPLSLADPTPEPREGCDRSVDDDASQFRSNPDSSPAMCIVCKTPKRPRDDGSGYELACDCAKVPA